MKAVVERFGGEVTAYLVLEGMALGHIYHRAVGVKRYKLSVQTKGGHSWSDHGLPSAIHELSKLAVELTALALPKEPRTTLNVGRIGGGTSINVIAPEAWLELDLRSEGQAELERLIASVEKVMRAAHKPGVSVEAEVIGQRPAGELSPAHSLVRLAEESIRAVGLEPVLTTGSTDANIPLSKGFPALVLGVTTGGNAHTKAEFVNTEPVERGLEQLVRFVERVLAGSD
jgi:acetylornithine deacetylase/succinyl-diaminopimelate desuccinylase-like protein